MMQKYIGSDVTSMVTLPVIVFEPMLMLQKMAELMEYSYLMDLADECEDPYMRLIYASSFFITIYYACRRTWDWRSNSSSTRFKTLQCIPWSSCMGLCYWKTFTNSSFSTTNYCNSC